MSRLNKLKNSCRLANSRQNYSLLGCGLSIFDSTMKSDSRNMSIHVMLCAVICGILIATEASEQKAAPEAPAVCITPTGFAGRCVDINDCAALHTLLHQKPIPEADKTFLRHSKCNGPFPYGVCCKLPQESTEETKTTAHCVADAGLPDPDSGCCGQDVAYDIISASQVAILNQDPWTALIEYRKDNQIKLLCGGVLISAKYVLTAGHCIAGAVLKFGIPVNVRLGEYDTKTDRDCAPAPSGGEDCNDPPTIIAIEAIIHHPLYDAATRTNDVALLRLTTPAPYTDFIRPICLPSADVSHPLAESFVAPGWPANSTIKQRLQFRSVSNQVCQLSYKVPPRVAQLGPRQMCVVGVDGRNCKGDTGGPLVHRRGDRFELVGVASFGPLACGTTVVPRVYSRVYEYKDWIVKELKA